MKDLLGKTAVVTGAASGIGRATAIRCAAEGMNVVLADIEGPLLDLAVAEILATGVRAIGVKCDVSDSAQVEALRDRALTEFGAVHLLMNNAGVAYGRPNHKTSPAQWQWVVGVNLLGVAYGVSAFVPAMIEQGEGHIVNTASEAGLTATPMLGSYHATKYAVVGLSESLSLELEATNVNVSCLCPELVDTKIFESVRNAPAALNLSVRPAPVSIIEELMGTVAMDPADVAADVIYAVKANRFWIITHQVTEARILQRNRDLEAGRRPRMPLGPTGL